MFACLRVQRRVGGFEEVEVSFHASLAGVGCIKLLLQRPQLGLVQPLSLRVRETERERGRGRERGRERESNSIIIPLIVTWNLQYAH